MSKRELEQLSGANEIEGPRTKRRRETAGTSSDLDMIHSDPIVGASNEISQGGGGKNEVVLEQGLKLWQTVKDAVNKEGRSLSLDFLRRPSKRQYPDYYELIQRPIALDDIKKQLDHGGYSTFEAVKQDFELCFSNAKQYNRKDSDIWKDAKDLLKLVNKTYNKMVPMDDDGENKSKAPNLMRLLKSRLQKLVDKADDSGRMLSQEFMELPSKKEWPIYYKEIKRPQCLENIFKRIKRKEYYNSGEFAADVELVFANAMLFNQEHTGIWEDARTLRDYFRQLMADMPAPFALPEYTKPSNGKIKIKVPQLAQPPGASPSAPAAQPPAPLLLRVPASHPVKSSPAATPVLPDLSPLATTTTPPPVAAPVALPPTPQPIQPPTGPAPAPSYTNTIFSHYPNASYIPPAVSSTSALPTQPAVQAQAHSVSHSPAPLPLPPSHQLKSMALRIAPRGRAFDLDYRDGVKCWAMRMVPGETEVVIDQVTFMSEEDEGSSGEEEETDEHEEEEEEEHEDVPAKNGRKKGKGKGRGRPKMVAKVAKTKTAAVKKKKPKIGPIQVKLNGTLVNEEDEGAGKWVVRPVAGSNVLEVGENGGLIWKVYIQNQ